MSASSASTQARPTTPYHWAYSTEDIFDLSPAGLACLEQHNARQFCNTEWDDAEWFALLNRKPYYKTEEKP
jgi:hypothetical protein